jgi:histidinol-phosphate aminotransferase
MTHERATVRRAAGYVPGRQLDLPDIVKLNTNENPYPPGSAVMAALASLTAESLRRYPPPLADGFRAAAAAVHRLTADHVIAVNGGDELLRLCVQTFVDPGRPIGSLEPSYSLYRVLAALNDSPLASLELTQDWAIPGDAADRWNAAGARLAFVVNPHAPSGRLSPTAELAALAERFTGVLVIDEAYVDFVDPSLRHDATELVRERDNVILLRTLSKGYSLAGLRLGYGLGGRDLIAPMIEKTRDSYNVDIVAQTLGTAALREREQAAATWTRIRGDRESLRAQLAGIGVTAPPSQSNFLLAQLPAGVDAADVCRRLEAEHILVRHFATARLADKLRISIGTPEQHTRLIEAMKRILARAA